MNLTKFLKFIFAHLSNQIFFEITQNQLNKICVADYSDAIAWSGKNRQ